MSSSQSSSYNEETIVTQITTIYNLLLKLSYFSSDQVTFPPEGGYRINEELCHSLHLAPQVISLMKKVPYPVDGYHKPIMWQSRAFEYLLDEELRNGRDPEQTGVVDDDDHPQSQLKDIANWNQDIIRLIDESKPPEGDFREETEAHNAPTYLQKVIDDIQTLQVVYVPGGDIGYIHLPGSWEQNEIKRILTEGFGWGAEFREEDWWLLGEEQVECLNSTYSLGKTAEAFLKKTNFDLEKVGSNEGNSGRYATPQELLEVLSLLKCHSHNCEKERADVGHFDDAEGVESQMAMPTGQDFSTQTHVPSASRWNPASGPSIPLSSRETGTPRISEGTETKQYV